MKLIICSHYLIHQQYIYINIQYIIISIQNNIFAGHINLNDLEKKMS